ncbi:MAG: solute carrier family 23 protein [Deltaproteobacteria bacterium]
MTRPKNLVYAVDEMPPFLNLGVLGLQLVSVLAIYLVLMVIVVREAGASAEVAQHAVSFGMIALGAGAVFQGLWKGPVGSGYLAPPVLSAVYLHNSIMAARIGGLPLVYGMTIIAGIFEGGLSRVLLRLRRYFPPVVSGLIVLAVGLELGLVGVEKLLDVSADAAGAHMRTHIAVATLTLSVMVGLSIWARGMWRLLCTLIGIIAGLAAAIATGLLNPADVARIWAAPIFAIPDPSDISYSFDLSLLIPFLFAGLAAGLRVIGVVISCQQINDADWTRPEMGSIRGGVLADGIGCAVSGLLGGMGMSSAPSAVGVSKASGATSRYIALAIGFWFTVFACFPKVAAMFLALPMSVVGAGSRWCRIILRLFPPGCTP